MTRGETNSVRHILRTCCDPASASLRTYDHTLCALPATLDPNGVLGALRRRITHLGGRQSRAKIATASESWLSRPYIPHLTSTHYFSGTAPPPCPSDPGRAVGALLCTPGQPGYLPRDAGHPPEWRRPPPARP